MKVFFDTVGCRLNQAEIEKMALEFRTAGHEVVENATQADLVVVNTCTVTAAAASDSRQKIRQAMRMGVTKIVATGCWATMSPQEAKALPGVSNVVLNADKAHLVEKIIGEHAADFELEPLERVPLPGVHRRTRAFIKVQDGCNNFCTFCVTRIARGASVSLNKELVLNEVLSAEKGGANEIVLSGVHLGSWGKDFSEQKSLADLVNFLLEQTSIPRIRLSSIEPWDLDEKLFDLWKNPRLCQHFHLPLQSGCAATLKRMARHTTPDQYKQLVQLIRRKMPEAAITTDIIVGFPGETDNEFEQSLQFIEEMQFASGHLFKFSAREGTAANRLPGKINGKITHQRSQQLRAILAQSETLYHQHFLDHQVSVLWESVSGLSQGGWRVHGLTENYLPVTSWSKENLWNTISQVKINKLNGDSLEGEILP
jgi:threonylcarbamoyladenosine tRNA methylthiotransferase MtaB